MKLALRYIPTEVWVDVFCYPWISRKQLGRIVHRFRNRKFTEFLQFYLHEWGKRTLETVYLVKEASIPRTPIPGNFKFFDNIYDSDKEILSLDKTFSASDIPLTPMPDNIKFFKHIEIRHLDSLALGFLRRINTLFTNVNMYFNGFEPGDDLANLRTVFDHLLPLVHGIHSLGFEQSAIPRVEQYFAQQLAQVKTLSIDLDSERFNPTSIQPAINFCMNWLTSDERDPTEPRMLVVCIFFENFEQFSMAVREQFLSAKRPSTFMVHILLWGNPHIDNFHLENNLGEQLYGEFNGFWKFQINRHQPNAGPALHEWFEQTVTERRKCGSIEIHRHVTIGQIDGNADANGVDNVGKEEADQPSTSGQAQN